MPIKIVGNIFAYIIYKSVCVVWQMYKLREVFYSSVFIQEDV